RPSRRRAACQVRLPAWSPFCLPPRLPDESRARPAEPGKRPSYVTNSPAWGRQSIRELHAHGKPNPDSPPTVVVSRTACAKARTNRAFPSDRFFGALAGADANRFVHGHDENLAVADAAGLRALLDRVDDLMDHLVRDDDLELHLRHEIHPVRRASLDLLLAAAPSTALHLRHGHALDADLRKGILHFVQLERLDDRLDLLHLALHSFGVRPGARGHPYSFPVCS